MTSLFLMNTVIAMSERKPPVDVSLHRSGPVPLHAQIADHFRKQIKGLFWPANHKLRSEEQLAEDLGVARGTVRRAIRALVEEGLLVQVQGNGTFVAGLDNGSVAERAKRSLSGPLISNGEQLVSVGIEFHDRLLEYSIRPANSQDSTSAIKQHSSFQNAEVLTFQRLRSLRDGPDGVISTDVSLAAIPGLRNVEPAELTKGSFHELLRRRFAIEFAYAERVYTACAANERLAELLDVGLGTPLLVHDQYSYDSTHRCVEHSRAWTRTDRHSQTIIVKGVT